MRRRSLALVAALVAGAGLARADAVDTLRAFVREVKSGQASFTQTVLSADGKRTKTSQGRFEFARPNRFRFEYLKPFEQTIVADGRRVWIHDPDLNQASSRALGQALGATPAALLAGGPIDDDFALAAQPSEGGIDWVQATPRAKDGPFVSMRVGFRGQALAAVEIVDSFGQRSRLAFDGFVANPPLPAERFRFVPPPGTEVLEQ